MSSPSIDESSGLSASRAHRGVLYTHNDSGDSARVFAVREDGTLVGMTLPTTILVVGCSEGFFSPTCPGVSNAMLVTRNTLEQHKL